MNKTMTARPSATVILLFGAGGPLSADVEESCRRSGVVLAAAILNRPGDGFCLDISRHRRVEEMEPEHRTLPFLCPLFTPANRRIAVAEAQALGFAAAPALVDPTAIVASSAVLGDGGYVNAGSILGAATRLGRHVIVNRGASIGHHGEIGDFASIGPGAVIAGQVRIGPGVLVGAGAVIEPGLELGADSVVAAGAVLRQDLPPGAIATGNPARIATALRRSA
jgi:sugar O-acyltransferase (sialic acid O-acetyltransferase NeuD family)